MSIWALAERRIVARCPGHHSWVTSVAFDPWRCDGRNYRFGSVGEDCRLLLWDFNVGMLRRPKTASIRQRARYFVTKANHQNPYEDREPGYWEAQVYFESECCRLRRGRTDGARGRVADDNCDFASCHGKLSQNARTPKRTRPKLILLQSKVVDEHIMSGLAFEEDCIITTCAEGHIRIWVRPQDTVSSSQVNLSRET